MVNVKDSAPESEEQKFKQKCNELKKRIAEVEESNEIATIALARTRMTIRRLRLEHSILLERLEEQILRVPGSDEFMSLPPNPTLLDDALNIKVVKNAPQKSRKNNAPLNFIASTKKAIRDPDLPKRPTNAYLIFCEKEKANIENTTAKSDGKGSNDISRILADTWKGMDEEQRKPYQLLYEEDRERYKKEMIDYNRRRQDSELKQSLSEPTFSSTGEIENSNLSELLESDQIKRQKMSPIRENITQRNIDGTSQEVTEPTGS